jgi:hypothetical protein
MRDEKKTDTVSKFLTLCGYSDVHLTEKISAVMGIGLGEETVPPHRRRSGHPTLVHLYGH